MVKSLRFHIPWVIWLTLILVLCLTPGDKIPKIEWELISIGTLAHFTFYFVLTVLALFGFLAKKKNPEEKKLNLSNGWLYLVIVLASISIGYGIELMQREFIYQRYYDPEDVLVNSLGTVFGAFSYSLIGRKIVLIGRYFD